MPVVEPRISAGLRTDTHPSDVADTFPVRAPTRPALFRGLASIRLVVLDVDDTIVLNEAVSFEIENGALDLVGRLPMSRATHRATWGMPLLEAMEYRSPGVDPEAFGIAFREVFFRYHAAGLVDVVPQQNLVAIDVLRGEGRQVMILTSRSAIEVEHLIVESAPLASRISATYHLDRTRHAKPDPRVFDELLADTGIDPADCLYVGDTPGDAAAANGAGIPFVACLESELRSREQFDGHQVAAYLATFPDIVGAVLRLERGRRAARRPADNGSVISNRVARSASAM
ncbi:phosphoglycolate phosphatase-like HAD superfamily hydrolase [Hamadaea flava]|uniref:HAD family hydrolase n=1 Tax=Hamadaea flava TaxID=1742688 RepID=A0ABV8LLE6_9ACTN|nr:phosphoglycolate phosphatase-like HAD superfamily hydrolase [Hamadaea flava]